MTAVAARPLGTGRDLTWQTVVVIGGTAGIGPETALLAREQEADLIAASSWSPTGR